MTRKDFIPPLIWLIIVLVMASIWGLADGRELPRFLVASGVITTTVFITWTAATLYYRQK